LPRDAADSAARYAPASAPSNSSSDILNRLRVVAATGEAPKNNPRRKVDGDAAEFAGSLETRAEAGLAQITARSMLARQLASNTNVRGIAGATSGARSTSCGPSPADDTARDACHR
jgi:hypothetical protein